MFEFESNLSCPGSGRGLNANDVEEHSIPNEIFREQLHTSWLHDIIIAARIFSKCLEHVI